MISVKGNLTGKLNTTYTKIYPELENLTVTPSEEQQKFIHEDMYGYDKVVVNPIPDKYIIPNGSLDITENGNYNVKEKEFANVNVPTKTLGIKTITTNGTYLATDDGIDGYSKVNVETSGVDINNYLRKDVEEYTLSMYGIPTYSHYIKKLPIDNSKQIIYGDYYFNTCQASEIDFLNFDTSSMISMNSMFRSCKKLTSLDLSNFNTSNVTIMEDMFAVCSSLTSLDLSSFDTSKVTNMKGMFADCSKLTSLNLSNFNTSKVTSMSSMFNECNNLESLDLSSFNTSNVTSMHSMFSNNNKLTNLDLSNFDTTKVTNMSLMFNGCYVLRNLNISNFDFTNVTSYDYMFNNMYKDCYILVKDATAKEWITSKFTNLTNVHYVGEIE